VKPTSNRVFAGSQRHMSIAVEGAVAPLSGVADPDSAADRWRRAEAPLVRVALWSGVEV
jgi:hypothetical protein